MPYKTEHVDNLEFLTHKGITIYHTYEDDDADNCLLTYWFTQCPDCGELGDFDVRELSTAKNHPMVHEGEDVSIRAAIIEAIDKGEITKQTECLGSEWSKQALNQSPGDRV